jgi:hypothetical protein
MGMVSPIGRWLRQELKPWSDELVAGLERRELGLPQEPPEDGDYDRRRHALISLELWFRRFIDQCGEASPANSR